MVDFCLRKIRHFSIERHMSRLPASTKFQREAFNVYGVLRTGTYQQQSMEKEAENMELIQGLMSRSTVHGKRQCLKQLTHKVRHNLVLKRQVFTAPRLLAFICEELTARMPGNAFSIENMKGTNILDRLENLKYVEYLHRFLYFLLLDSFVVKERFLLMEGDRLVRHSLNAHV